MGKIKSKKSLFQLKRPLRAIFGAYFGQFCEFFDRISTKWPIFDISIDLDPSGRDPIKKLAKLTKIYPKYAPNMVLKGLFNWKSDFWDFILPIIWWVIRVFWSGLNQTIHFRITNRFKLLCLRSDQKTRKIDQNIPQIWL